jgi:hypothetical protein
MLTFWGGRQKFCDGVSRRNFLKLGAMGLGGLTLADMLRLKAAGAATGANKSVIVILLPGGPPHMDMYDLKPEAPSELRGEFKPVRTNVPGMDICELMPLQAKIADKLAIIRGLKTVDDHTNYIMTTGFPSNMKKPAFGSIISKVKGAGSPDMPAYVSLMGGGGPENPMYVGTAHRPFVPSGPGLENLARSRGITLDRLQDRKALLGAFDNLRRDMDARGEMAGADAFNAQAFDMLTTGKARDAFDVAKEDEKVRAKYGRSTQFLQARRLVEAGVSIVTLSIGSWDTHGQNFTSMKRQLPELDRAVTALVTDLSERGLDKDVTVLMWGEFGRTPRINKDAGRDHWPSTGIALMAGGGLKMGQVVGASDPRGERPVGKAITPPMILSTMYRALGIDPAATIMDNFGRPQYLLDEREPIHELI